MNQSNAIVPDPKPSVLMVVTLFSVGGATETVVAIAGGLRARGYSVDIVTGLPLPAEGDMYEAAASLGIPVVTLPHLVRSVHPLNDLIAFFQLLHLMRSRKYTIVHTHSSKAGILGRLAARFVRVPVVVHTIHGFPFHGFQPFIVRKLFVLIERMAAHFSDAIVAVSQAIVDQCRAVRIGREDQFTVIRSGFDVDQFIQSGRLRARIRAQYGLRDNEIAIGTISRLADLKGHKYILLAGAELCVRYPQIKFFFIGDGEIRDQLQQQAEHLGLRGHIVFTGLLDPKDIPGIISAMDFIVHPSLHEGLARVLPQSIIAGKKVVSFALAGVSEVIRGDATGYVVPTEDVVALREVCQGLCADESTRCVEANERSTVADEFSTTTMVQRTMDLYQRIWTKKMSQGATHPQDIRHPKGKELASLPSGGSELL
jgi:glycosyltransferase involved in cell wall biosynthesis